MWPQVLQRLNPVGDKTELRECIFRSNKRKESALKTINAHLWKLGAVSLAFVLAITLLISSSPVTTVEAATCTMDITEIATPTTGDAVVDAAVAADALALAVDDGSAAVAVTYDMGFGAVITVTGTNAPEKIRIGGDLVGDSVVILERGVGASSAVILTNDAVISGTQRVYADNGMDCTTNVSATQTITLTSDAAQTAEIWVLERDLVAAVVLATNLTNIGSPTDTTGSLVSVTNLAVGDVATFACATPALTFEQVELTTVGTAGGNDSVIKRGVNGTTACATTAATIASSWYPWHDSAVIGAEGVTPLVNGLASKNTFAERRYVDVKTARTSGGYSGTFTVSSAAAGKALIAAKSQNAGVKYNATTANSESLVFMTFHGAPSDYVDDDLNGKYTAAGDTDRSSISAMTASVGAVTTATTTDTLTFNFVDAVGTELIGTATVTLLDAPAGVTFADSGTQSVTTPTTTATTQTEVVNGLPGSGNFRYTYSVAYTGTTGTLSLTNGVIKRTNNVLSSLTMKLQNIAYSTTTVYTDVTGNIRPQTIDDGNLQRVAVATAAAGDQEIDGNYFIYVHGTDSAGNATNALVSFTDDDGLSTLGLGNTTGIILDNAALAVANISGHTGTVQLSSTTGIARTGVDIAAAGIYNLTATSGTISATMTLNVRGTASTYTMTGPDSISPGSVGVFTVWGYDANGFKLSADKAVTIVNANSQTGGAIVPSNGDGTISKSTGLSISVIAPQKGGTGTLAIVVGGAVVASKTLTFAAEVTGAALSGTGCTGAATGSYTCVVTSGDTASAVATAAGAVSIWQSDADGVLQGYVVGTPDFVDTGLASTAAIASSSAIIVVR